LKEKTATPVSKSENTAVGIRHADNVATSMRKKLALTSPIIGSRLVGIVRSRSQATEFSLALSLINSTEKNKNVLSLKFGVIDPSKQEVSADNPVLEIIKYPNYLCN
jgi:hypothetical protein